MRLPEFSIVVPVYNEAENIVPLLRGLESTVRGDYEIVLVYDFDGDTTVPAVQAMDPPASHVRLLKNELGKGVVNALRAGLAGSRGWLGALVMMADLSDPPECVGPIIQKMRAGSDVVAGSRYMSGGAQIGGPKFKGLLSRTAGFIAYWFTGIGIHDVTTNFRGYSRRLIAEAPVESTRGFEVGLELTVKCHLRGWRLAEVPATWRDRTSGQSRFRLFKWLPGYLRWYLRLLALDPFGLSPRIRSLRQRTPKPQDCRYFGVYEQPGYGWTVRRFLPAAVIVPWTTDGRILLLRVRRPFHDSSESYWEVPGGAVDPGESILETAHRELFEETGYKTADPGCLRADHWEAVPGMGSCPHGVVVLRNCELSAAATGAADEGIETVAAYTPDEVRAMIANGRIRAMPSIAALQLALS